MTRGGRIEQLFRESLGPGVHRLLAAILGRFGFRAHAPEVADATLGVAETVRRVPVCLDRPRPVLRARGGLALAQPRRRGVEQFLREHIRSRPDGGVTPRPRRTFGLSDHVFHAMLGIGVELFRLLERLDDSSGGAAGAGLRLRLGPLRGGRIELWPGERLGASCACGVSQRRGGPAGFADGLRALGLVAGDRHFGGGSSVFVPRLRVAVTSLRFLIVAATEREIAVAFALAPGTECLGSRLWRVAAHRGLASVDRSGSHSLRVRARLIDPFGSPGRLVQSLGLDERGPCLPVVVLLHEFVTAAARVFGSLPRLGRPHLSPGLLSRGALARDS